MEANSNTQAESGADSVQLAACQEPPSAKVRCRKEKRPRNPEAYFLSAEEVGYMIGIQEVDARALMQSGAIRAYKIKSRLKTTRPDVDDFLQKLRVEGKGLANVVVVHVPVLKSVAGKNRETDKLDVTEASSQRKVTRKSSEQPRLSGPPILKQRSKQKQVRDATSTQPAPVSSNQEQM